MLFVDTVLYPSDYGRHQGAHICIYLEWGLHDEYGEPGETASDVSGSWGGGALREAQWVQGTWEQWHLQLVHSNKGAIAYHSTVVAEVLWGIVKRLDSPLPRPHGGGWRPSLRHCQQSKINLVMVIV